MNYLVKLNCLALVFMVLLASCDESEDPSADNGGNVPENYEFTDSEGNSTVSFSGQVARLDQLEEITAYLKTANTPGTSLDAAQIKDMYSNAEGEGSEHFSADAAVAGKQLKSKTARGHAGVQETFEGYMDNIAAISQNTEENTFVDDTAGVVQSGSSQYLVNATGVEYTQLIEKGLMGAVFYDQIQNNYLSDDQLNVDNETPEEGDTYTAMEHHWDEAFGYFTTASNFPDNESKRFWGKYCDGVDDLLGTNAKIMEAFIAGRQAIVDKDYETRDAQRDIIREELKNVCAATALHYLNSSIADYTNIAARCHQLSEAVAFAESLKYSHDRPDESALQSVLDQLKVDGEYNFYEVSSENIEGALDELATLTGLTDQKGDF